jgi:hypothetical protein
MFGDASVGVGSVRVSAKDETEKSKEDRSGMNLSPFAFALLGEDGEDGEAMTGLWTLGEVRRFGLGRGDLSCLTLESFKPLRRFGEEAARPADAGKKPRSLLEDIPMVPKWLNVGKGVNPRKTLVESGLHGNGIVAGPTGTLSAAAHLRPSQIWKCQTLSRPANLDRSHSILLHLHQYYTQQHGSH